jgi:hypothetical protein
VPDFPGTGCALHGVKIVPEFVMVIVFEAGALLAGLEKLKVDGLILITGPSTVTLQEFDPPFVMSVIDAV